VTKTPRCPTDQRGPYDVVGCGSDEVCHYDEHNVYECLECGMWFKPGPDGIRGPTWRRGYDVGMCYTVRVKFKDVEATSQIDAIRTADRGFDPEKSNHFRVEAHSPIHVVEYAEWAEEINGAMVDEADDREEYEKSGFYIPSGDGLHDGNWMLDFWTNRINRGRREREKRCKKAKPLRS